MIVPGPAERRPWARGVRLDVTQAVRRVQGYDGPWASWLANASKTQRVFPEVFTLESKPVHYREAEMIAVSRVSDKPEVLQWVIDTKPTDRELRDRIRVVTEWLSRTVKENRDRQNDLIRKLWLACYTNEEIGEAVGLTKQSVNERVSQEQFPGNQSLLTNPHATDFEVPRNLQ